MTASGIEVFSEAQRILLSYWLDRCDASGVPTRSAMHPGQLRAFLGDLSLVELRPGDGALVRIAGSRLADIVGPDAQGRRPEELNSPFGRHWNDRRRIQALRSGLPLSGLNTADRVRHAWLRLPLSDGAGRVGFVLCHDQILGGADLATPGHRKAPAIRAAMNKQAA